MAYGAGAFQNNPRVANHGTDDESNFQRMLQYAALASMMNEKAALGFGLGSLLGGAINHKKNAADSKKIANMNAQNGQVAGNGQYSFAMPSATDALMQKYNGILDGKKPITMQEVTSAGAALNQTPQGGQYYAWNNPTQSQVTLNDGTTINMPNANNVPTGAAISGLSMADVAQGGNPYTFNAPDPTEALMQKWKRPQ